ncbi:hypothetical protein VP01_463g12 [Puccinia sorghi]|uniref:Uncharacterized protein n=1 Tax=Puccinia sorghi TaxID=27349 RepID=A0A0L6UNC5_9BASI|nr:hypothetical protein VP01_463g12 [Puccinia sorghi]
MCPGGLKIQVRVILAHCQDPLGRIQTNPQLHSKTHNAVQAHDLMAVPLVQVLPLHFHQKFHEKCNKGCATLHETALISPPSNYNTPNAIWYFKPVWAHAQVLGTVPRGLGNVPRGLENPSSGGPESWHIAKIRLAEFKLMADQSTTTLQNP